MRKWIFLCLPILLMFPIAHAQINLRWGGEFGAGAWGLPMTDSYTGAYSSNETQEGMNRCFMAGLNARWLFGKYFQVQHGLNYHGTSQHYYSTAWYAYFTGSGGGYSYTNNIQRKYRQLLMPLTLGFSFRAGKVRPSFQVGGRLGLMVAANDERTYEYVSTGPQPENTTTVTDSNPFAGSFGKRFQGQLLFSTQLEIGSWFYMGFNFAVGKTIENPIPNMGGFDFRNREISFVMGIRPFGHVFQKK